LILKEGLLNNAKQLPKPVLKWLGEGEIPPKGNGRMVGVSAVEILKVDGRAMTEFGAWT
jgi:hypothetical protein